jgi:RimJ/RimL family protein N-acetyltransferase
MSPPQPAKGPPQRLTLEGRYTRLEPVGLRHAADLFAAVDGPRFRWLFEGPPQTEAEMIAWVEAAAISADRVYFAVIDKMTGRAEGRHALMNIVPAHGSIEVGGVYWGPRLSRTRAATEALFLHARYVFDELGYRRFEWKCNNLNEPSKAAARRFGFVFEGVFRQHMIIKGESRDTAWFSMLDGDWRRIRSEYERWLAPSNFSADGLQKTPLRVPS